MKNLALLCDYGLDDVIATLYLFKYAHKFDKIDIVAVAGNMPLSVTLNNAKRILTHAGNVPKNLRIVDSSCIKQNCEELYDIHGKDGMGDVLPQSFDEDLPVIDYSKWLLEVDDSYTLVSLGPCTVTAHILKTKGSLPLIMMCSNISEAPNYNGYEFNHGIDPDAFSQCVRFPHKCATLDTCHCGPCDLYGKEIKEDGLFSQLVLRYRDMCKERNDAYASVYDLTAIVYLLHPERFESYEDSNKFGNKITVLKYISDLPVIE
ncbi:MAG: nucleoside hydrolase [Acutalibacteraceae bacterium]|nr:nucleoside hydrolase [Acutalibacteraceae bacterium]